MLSHDEILALETRDRVAWDAGDAILYALAAGMGSNPLDSAQLDYVDDARALKVLPTLPVAMLFNGGPLERIGYDFGMTLHGEQAITLHRPVPSSCSGIAHGRIAGAWDKGEGRGAVFAQEVTFVPDGDVDPLCTIVMTAFARADGGYGGPSGGQPRPHPIPERTPDHSLEFATLPQQALLYRLCRDRNPLHVNPDVAKAAGFPRPILHGLCTYAICCRAVIAQFCDDPALLRHFAARFTAAVYPGDTIVVDMWRDGDVVAFRAGVPARNQMVIDNGKAIIFPA